MPRDIIIDQRNPFQHGIYTTDVNHNIKNNILKSVLEQVNNLTVEISIIFVNFTITLPSVFLSLIIL